LIYEFDLDILKTRVPT